MIKAPRQAALTFPFRAVSVEGTIGFLPKSISERYYRLLSCIEVPKPVFAFAASSLRNECREGQNVDSREDAHAHRRQRVPTILSTLFCFTEHAISQPRLEDRESRPG